LLHRNSIFSGTIKGGRPYLRGRRGMAESAPDRIAEEAFNIAWEFVRPSVDNVLPT
jgi:hypothetical protein